ncbi:MAG: hypothetical protein JXA15_09370 [Spirochaetales bacterium]|nr:hypothetical protein [Spirochaetales bacterium]
MKELSIENVAVGVFTSALNLRERALSVQETWLRDFPNALLIGGWKSDPELRMASLGPEVGEDYASAHKKQFLGLLELRRRFPGASWYFLTGCDAYVYADNLRALLAGFDPERELLIGGHCGQAEIRGERLIFPAGGPGFALSRALVEALATAIPAFIDAWPSEFPDLAGACDVAMAWLAKRERSVKVTFADGFYSCPPYRYPGNPYLDGNGIVVDRPVADHPVAYHALGIREMYLLRRGSMPRAPGPLARAYDVGFRFVARRFRTKSLVNRISSALANRSKTRG